MSHKIKVLVCCLLVLALVFAQIDDFRASAEPVTIGIMSFAGLVIALLGAYGISMAATHASRPKVAQMTLQLWQDWQTETASPVDSGLGNQLELVRDSQNNQYIKVSSTFTQKFKSFASWLVQTHSELLAGEIATVWSQPGTGNVSLAGIGDIPVLFDVRYSDWYNREYHEGDALFPDSYNLFSRWGGTGDLVLPSTSVMRFRGDGAPSGTTALTVVWPDGYQFPKMSAPKYTRTQATLTEYMFTQGIYLVHDFYEDVDDTVNPSGFADRMPQITDAGHESAEWAFLFVNVFKYKPTSSVSGSSTYKTTPYYYYHVTLYNLSETSAQLRGAAYGSNELIFDIIFGDAPVDLTLPSTIVAVPDGAVDVPTWDIPADRDIYVGADFIYPGISLDVALENAVDCSVTGTLADTNLRSLDSVETEALEEDTGYESIETSSPDSDSLQPVFGLDMVFPFCIPFDVAYFVERLQAARVAPSFDWPIVVPSLGIEETIHVDLSGWETVAGILRTLELIVFIIGLAYATRSMFIRG